MRYIIECDYGQIQEERLLKSNNSKTNLKKDFAQTGNEPVSPWCEVSEEIEKKENGSFQVNIPDLEPGKKYQIRVSSKRKLSG